MEIADQYILTDMSVPEMMSMANFVRSVPKQNQFLAMLPGNFSGTGDWLVSRPDVRRMVARLMGSSFVTADRPNVRVTVENDSSRKGLGTTVAKYLRSKGYVVNTKAGDSDRSQPLKRTRIIAQRANPEEAEMVQSDLGQQGDIVNASVGDIETAVTVLIGDDLRDLPSASK